MTSDRAGAVLGDRVRGAIRTCIAAAVLWVAMGCVAFSAQVSFTATQVQLGLTFYAQYCASCHGLQLQGGSGIALAGSSFQARWRGRALRDLHFIAARQMPLNAPGSMSEAEDFAILAFVLSRNGYAAGAAAFGASMLGASLFPTDDKVATVPPGPEPALPDLPAAPKFFATPTTSVPTDEELLKADAVSWLMYNKDYRSQRYSALSQINAHNAHRLVAVCAFQLGQVGWYQPSPVEYEGVLYVTAADSTYAIDAHTCRKIWQHDYIDAQTATLAVNRGVALYKGVIYRTTPAGHLIALDARTGTLLWDVWVCNTVQGYWLSAAPLVYEGKVYLGEAGGDSGANGHLYAFDAASGNRLWTFDLVARVNQPGGETWQNGAATGGGSTWSSYTIDPTEHLLLAPIGNPSPAYRGEARSGANLYSDSVVALDLSSGALRWYVQQLPHDTHDWDTAAPASIYDLNDRQYLAVANKGGWLYLYDRATHQLISQQEVSTHSNIDSPPSTEGVHACPGYVGGVQWNGPAYSPTSKALFVNSVEWCGIYTWSDAPFVMGGLYLGGNFTPDPVASAKGWIRRFDAASGRPNWVYQAATPMLAGVTPTAGGVLLTGDLNGDFMVMNVDNGNVIYRFNTGGAIAGGVSTYLLNGRQHIAVASGNSSRTLWGTSGAATVFIFALPR